jgi:SAM-dependent methyltransferase
MAAPTKSEINKHECEFYAKFCEATSVDSVMVEPAFAAPTALENRYILRKLGSLKGKAVLDVGCGFGEASVMFAKLGARVTATDLSPENLEFTRRLARHHDVSVETILGEAESLDFPREAFDVVYVANCIHHISDRQRFYEQVHSCLRPGGVMVSWDPLKYNPAINVYRRIVTDMRTPDEQPLGRKDLVEIRKVFPGARAAFFWLSALSLFLKYYLIDRRDPNRVPYFKQIYKETRKTLWWWQWLKRLDRMLVRLPGLGWLCWNIVIIAPK